MTMPGENIPVNIPTFMGIPIFTDPGVPLGEVQVRNAEPSPCPFCGGMGTLRSELRDGYQDGEPEAYIHSVVCVSCAASGPWFKTPGNARRMWNRRPDFSDPTTGATR